MSEGPGFRRWDRTGSTTHIRYSRSALDIKGQRWISQRLYRLMGHDSVFFANPGERLGQALGRGYNYFDLLDTGAHIQSLDQLPKENLRTASRLEKLAERAAACRHFETAREYYYRACLSYTAAIWGIYDSDDAEFVWITDKIRSTFSKVIEYGRDPVERVEIPFERTCISGILSLTPSRRKAPTVLFIPGMDVQKENTLNHLNNPYVQRGMNCLVIDGPGQGESLARRLWVDAENYARAGSVVLDYLVQRPEVDPEKIGIHGLSMGSYWGPLIALRDRRVKALSTHASCQYTKDRLFNEVSPHYRLRFQWMAGNLEQTELDALAAKMTLEGREPEITCPHIIFHGEFDDLTTIREVYDYFNRLGSSVKEFRIYENEFHGIYRFWDEISNMSADWMRDRLNGVPPAQGRRVVLIGWDREERPVDEERLARGFSFFEDRSG